MDSFLRSFENIRMGTTERKVLDRTKSLFLSFIVCLSFLMITDTLYSILQPYLWLHSVLSIEDSGLSYDVVIQSFYICNTLFALTLQTSIRFFKRQKARNLKEPKLADTLLKLQETVDKDS